MDGNQTRQKAHGGYGSVERDLAMAQHRQKIAGFHLAVALREPGAADPR
jgi:hypothetical protein